MGDQPEGYSWNGTLEETDIRSIYGACYSLRFSGWLELKDAAHEAKILFVGGDPVEISGGDTQRISMWKDGSFRAVQKIPDFEGELIDSLEVSGTLAVTKPSALWAWISQYRLTCQIELERPKSKAVVLFQSGHAESALVNGLPELAALARVSSWTDGKFRVKLRPLFGDGVVVAIPPMPDSDPANVLSARQFDVSRAVQLEPSPRTPWPGERDVDGAPAERVEPTARTRTPPAGQPRPPVDVLRAAVIEPSPLRTRSTWPWLVAAALVGAAGGAVALYQYHLPPFSPPPRPITEAPLVIETPSSPSPLASPVPALVPVAALVPSPVPVPPPVSVSEDKHDKEIDKLVQKGRLLMISGHAHSAADTFKRAQKLRPRDASLRVYEQQALGKLGHAELVLEGKGSAFVDGKKLSAPRKLKLPAGPHSIDTGDGASELTLKRGEKKKLHLKK